MKTRELKEDNIGEFAEWVDPDMAENLSRMYFRGIACTDDTDDSLKEAMIWELQSVEKNEGTESKICWLYSPDPSDMEFALNEYRKRAYSEDVVRTFFETDELDEGLQEVLKSCGFDLSYAESSDIRISLKDLKNTPLSGNKM